MGTGQLNAKRALTQLAAGEHQSFQASPLDYSEVPVIGWDYDHTRPLGVNSQNIYKFNQKLVPGSFISITLTFDRIVDKTGSPTTFNTGDSFTPSEDTDNPGEDQLTDLDLYLLPKGSNSITDAKAESRAFGTVDHIFFQIPEPLAGETGEYEFWVRQFNNNAGPEDYAVAWWADGMGPLTFGAGDMNQDGHVDASDIAAMMKALTNESSYASSLGMTTDEMSLYGDVNGDGKFTNADLEALLNLLKSGGGSSRAGAGIVRCCARWDATDAASAVWFVWCAISGRCFMGLEVVPQSIADQLFAVAEELAVHAGAGLIEESGAN